MHRDDLLSQIRQRARLHGRNQARRVVQAVMQSLRTFVPETEFRSLVAQLPPDIDLTPVDTLPPGDNLDDGTGAGRRLIRDIARRLHVSEPDAAFYTRVTFAQLNAYSRGDGPALIAGLLPAELRPLVSAQADDPALRHRNLIRTLGAAVPSLSLRGPETAPRIEQTESANKTSGRVSSGPSAVRRIGAKTP
jgi:uncharacterized protein (DUF2267 family)